MGHVTVPGSPTAAITRLAEWWTQAAEEARWSLFEKSIQGDPEAPPLRALHIAIYLAEAEAGKVAEG